MFQYHCLNPIAQKGLDIFDDNYKKQILWMTARQFL